MAHRDKSQSPEFTAGIDAKRIFVDKQFRPKLQRMTQSVTSTNKFAAMHWATSSQQRGSLRYST